MEINTNNSSSTLSTNANQKVQNDKQQLTTNEVEEQQDVEPQQSVYVNLSPEAEKLAAQGNDGGGHPTRPPKESEGSVLNGVQGNDGGSHPTRPPSSINSLGVDENVARGASEPASNGGGGHPTRPPKNG